jgi:hypothetical protein
MLRRSSTRLLGHLAAGARSQRCQGLGAAAADSLSGASTSQQTSDSTSASLPLSPLAFGPALGSAAQQHRSISFLSWGRKPPSTPAAQEAAADEAAAEAAAVLSEPELPPPDEVPAEPTAADILQEASEILDASVMADVAAFAAAHVDRWWNVSWFMDMLGSLHYQAGVPWWVTACDAVAPCGCARPGRRAEPCHAGARRAAAAALPGLAAGAPGAACPASPQPRNARGVRLTPQLPSPATHAWRPQVGCHRGRQHPDPLHPAADHGLHAAQEQALRGGRRRPSDGASELARQLGSSCRGRAAAESAAARAASCQACSAQNDC